MRFINNSKKMEKGTARYECFILLTSYANVEHI